jgi:uncharacterized protein YcfJ
MHWSVALAPEPNMKVANKFLSLPFLAAALVASGTASAQAYGSQYGSPYGAPVVNGNNVNAGGYYDYARVIRVVPVTGAAAYPAAGQRCTSRSDAYAGDYYGPDGRYYGNGDPYAGTQRTRGSEGGRTMAGVLGTVIGAVVGSQVGGGSARYATAAIGSAVGGVAGRQVYDNAHRNDGTGTVTVCDPVDSRQPYPSYPADYPASTRGMYDVTYEYAGRTYVARTAYDPGDRIRVRVDVRPE